MPIYVNSNPHTRRIYQNHISLLKITKNLSCKEFDLRFDPYDLTPLSNLDFFAKNKFRFKIVALCS